MPIRIKNKELVALMRKLSERTGLGPTALLLDILEREVERLRAGRSDDEANKRSGGTER